MLRFLLLLSVFIPHLAAAEVGFDVVPIRAIFLHMHRDLPDRRFEPILMERLRADLTPELHVLENGMDLSLTPHRFGKLNADALLKAIASNLDPAENRGIIHVLLIDEDMKGPATNFNFAYSFGGAGASHRIIVVSLARLHSNMPALESARVAKLVLKNVARVSGYSGSELCVFGFARDLRELDAMPENFCEPDRAALMRGGLARP